MNILKLEAVAQQPLLIANRMQDRGNLLTSEETIGGTTLRGALAEALLGQIPEDHPFFQAAIVDERLSCGTLVPIALERQGRSLFMPRSIKTCKREGTEHAWCNLLFDKPGDCPKCASKLTRTKGYLLGTDPSETDALIRPKHQILTAVGLDKHIESVKEGDLFSRQVIVAGTRFRGLVWLDDLAPDLLKTITTLRVGLAKRSGFGKLSLTWSDHLSPSRDETARHLKQLNRRLRNSPLERAKNFPADQHLVTLDLQSPLVLSDTFMRPRLKLLPSDLTAYGPELTWDVLGCYGQLTQIGGWYALPNRPKTHRYAIVPGSVFALAVKGPEAQVLDALMRLQENGLGEGWGAGFGHVLVNHPIHTYIKEVSQ